MCGRFFALRYVINCDICALSDVHVLACELAVNSVAFRAVVFALRHVINCGIYALSDIYVLACELTVNSAAFRAVDFLLCGM